MEVLLLTGFEPFDGRARNPAGEIARELDGFRLPGWRVVGRVLPVDIGRIESTLMNLLTANHPSVVLSLGLAWGRSRVELERLAINFVRYDRPDNGGHRVEEAPVVPGGPAAYVTTLPVWPLVQAMSRVAPVGVSYCAGTHLCNWVMYRVLHHAQTERPHDLPPLLSGLVHLPAAAGMGRDVPVLERSTLLDAVRSAIRTITASSHSPIPSTD